jgi:hypothetical protein
MFFFYAEFKPCIIGGDIIPTIYTCSQNPAKITETSQFSYHSKILKKCIHRNKSFQRLCPRECETRCHKKVWQCFYSVGYGRIINTFAALLSRDKVKGQPISRTFYNAGIIFMRLIYPIWNTRE